MAWKNIRRQQTLICNEPETILGYTNHKYRVVPRKIIGMPPKIAVLLFIKKTRKDKFLDRS
jgi:hypothetical protein